MNLKWLVFISIASLIAFMVACGPGEDVENGEAEEEEEEVDPQTHTGGDVGPIQSMNLDEEIDMELAEEGKDIFQGRCESCHRIEDDRVGPAMGGITQRRTPEFIMNMILVPGDMLRQDPLGQKLQAQFATSMPAQNMDEDQARAVLEYFRKIDSEEDFDHEAFDPLL